MQIELLSPAKDLETGVAAINAGADALYVGGARFGAREAAGNSLGDIEALARYAHKYWGKVYVTLNTLLYDHELEEARELARQFYEAGADALIIQDVSLLALDLPPIPLFASTQMHNHTPERVAFLEQVGVQRAILARELSIEQIQAIRARTSTIELETFIHGALCVSYSGQCYLSHAIGGRSGNRGQCAQPCRLPYSLVDGRGETVLRDRHLLSLRDLNLTASLPALLRAGVTSFKIEGRLKDKTYVSNVVGHYRRQLDQLLRDLPAARPASSGQVELDFTPDVRKTFNRGYTSYFIAGRQETIGSHDTPKSTGEPLGRVVKIDHRSFWLEPFAPTLHPADGICFFTSDGALTGTTINHVNGIQIVPARMDGVRVGLMVYRNHDHVFSQQLLKTQTARKIRVRFDLSTSAAGTLVLSATDENGVGCQVETNAAFETAQQPARALETIEKQLRKLGGADFTCESVVIEMNPVLFVPVSVLNELRRSAIEALETARAQARPRLQRVVAPEGDTPAPFPAKSLTFEGNVLNQTAADFYRRHGVERIEPAAESGLDMTGRKVMTTRYCLRHELDACLREPQGLLLPEPLYLVDENGGIYPLKFNCKDCVMEVYYRTLPGRAA